MGPDRTGGCAPPLPEYSQAGSLPHSCPRPEGMRFVPHTSLPVLQPLSPNIPPAQGAHLAWRRGSSRAGCVVQLHQHSWGHTKSWVTVGRWLKPESKSWGLIIALGAGRAWVKASTRPRATQPFQEGTALLRCSTLSPTVQLCGRGIPELNLLLSLQSETEAGGPTLAKKRK